MEVYRLSKKKYAGSLSGVGAAKFGARWNSVGTEMIYSAANRSLAMAEVSVHFTLATLPPDYMMIEIYIPDDIKVLELDLSKLPVDWNSFPHSNSTKILGDEFIKQEEACILKVPSVVTKGDFNYLINPYHNDFPKIKILKVEPFPFDKRIFH